MAAHEGEKTQQGAEAPGAKKTSGYRSYKIVLVGSSEDTTTDPLLLWLNDMDFLHYEVPTATKFTSAGEELGKYLADQIMSGAGHVFVSGSGGAGKTRLLAQYLRGFGGKYVLTSRSSMEDLIGDLPEGTQVEVVKAEVAEAVGIAEPAEVQVWTRKQSPAVAGGVLDLGGSGLLRFITTDEVPSTTEDEPEAEHDAPEKTEAVSFKARDDIGIQVVFTGKMQPSSQPEDDDASFEMDDAYYEEVRQAVGQGTRSGLFGTSTKSLERHLRKLRDERRSREPAP
jgi:hypothetical protein